MLIMMIVMMMMTMMMKSLHSDEGLRLKTSVIRSVISTVYHLFYISYSHLTLPTQHHICYIITYEKQPVS